MRPPGNFARPIFRRSTTRPPAFWRAGAADGQLHDYWFPWVNGAAIHYGLVPKDKAGAIMDRLTAKIKEVGFTRFDLGLPGNLVPVPTRDYQFGASWRWGGGRKADGSDGFQHYENGGATACFAYFTLAALYDLGRRDEADQMLLPMLGAFDRGDFEGRNFLTRTKDWKSWESPSATRATWATTITPCWPCWPGRVKSRDWGLAAAEG